MKLRSLKSVKNSVKSVYDNIGLYTVKSLSIFIVSIYYLFFSSIMSIIIDNIIPHKTDEELKQMSTIQLGFDISIIVGTIAVGYYLVRNLLSGGPLLFDTWFFEGKYGYKHTMLKEASSGGIIVGNVIFFFQDRLRKRLGEFSRRFSFTMEATAAP
jgi:hypothetical protein